MKDIKQYRELILFHSILNVHLSVYKFQEFKKNVVIKTMFEKEPLEKPKLYSRWWKSKFFTIDIWIYRFQYHDLEFLFNWYNVRRWDKNAYERIIFELFSNKFLMLYQLIKKTLPNFDDLVLRRRTWFTDKYYLWTKAFDFYVNKYFEYIEWNDTKDKNNIYLDKNWITIKAAKYCIPWKEYELNWKTYYVCENLWDLRWKLLDWYDCSKLVTTFVTSLYWLFSLGDFNWDISSWDTSNVEDLNSTFRENKVFNQDISHWNVEKVKDLHYTFKWAKSFNQNLSNWKFNRLIFTAWFDEDTPNWKKENRINIWE